MAASYIGSKVAVKLENGSHLQGTVSRIDPNSHSMELKLVTLYNGEKKNTAKCLKLSSDQIVELELISMKAPPSKDSGSSNQSSPASSSEGQPPAPVTIMKRRNQPQERHPPTYGNHGNQAGQPFDNISGRKKYATFAAPTDQMMPDFDFDQSNKLFKKEAIFDEWRAKDGGVVKSNSDKLTSDEMVIKSVVKPTVDFTGEFHSDGGVPVRGLTHSKRQNLFRRASRMGVSEERVVVSAAVSIGQMLLQVLGGSCRINPYNHNKSPVVGVLVSGGRNGAIALIIAQHLLNHGVSVKVVIKAMPPGSEAIVNILKRVGCIIAGLDRMPSVIDLILDGVQDQETQSLWPEWMREVVSWAEAKAAPVLAIDPSISTDPAESKWSCAIGAPLSHQGESGRLYLVDIGIPKAAFDDESIPFSTPYMDKFIVPLYRNTS